MAIQDVGEQTAFDLAGFFPDLQTLASSTLLKDSAELGRLRRMFDENKIGANEVTLSESEKNERKKRQAEAKRLGNPIGKRLIEAGFARPSGHPWQAKTLIGPVTASAIADWVAHGTGAIDQEKKGCGIFSADFSGVGHGGTLLRLIE